MLITLEQLMQLFPKTGKSLLEQYVPYLNEMMLKYEIFNLRRARAFIAQVGHESGGFKYTTENLNYSAEGLRTTFRKYFTSKDPGKDAKLLQKAKDYARKPEKIANYVYADRMGNGPEWSGDGYKHRGVGLIQVTGKENQTKMAQQLGMPLDAAIVYAATPKGAVETACIFWHNHKLNTYADAEDMEGLTRAINGGTVGLEDRIKKYDLCKLVLIV